MFEGWAIVALAVGYVGLLFLIAWIGDRRAGRPRRRAAADLCAVAGGLLHVLDVLRQRRPCRRDRLRLPAGLSRPDPAVRVRLAADPAHRAAGQEPEHHLGRRLPRRPLRQEPGGGGHRHRHRGGRHAALHRAAAEGGRHLDETLLGGSPLEPVALPQLWLLDTALVIALALATFAVLFGTRHIDATEHQDGLMLAVAAESVVKLAAFLAVGVFVLFSVFGGIGDLPIRRARAMRSTRSSAGRSTAAPG